MNNYMYILQCNGSNLRIKITEEMQNETQNVLHLAKKSFHLEITACAELYLP